MRRVAALVAVCLLGACGLDPPEAPGAFKPIDPDVASFWDRQTAETAKLLRDIAADFNETNSGVPLKVIHSGTYTDIFRKVTASIHAKTLPALAVAYESMTAEYIRAGAVVAIDDWLDASEQARFQEDLDDFFPGVIETNRFARYENKLFSFPYTKSVLMLYFNKRVLSEAGIATPPETWDAFLDQCRTIKKATGKYALAIDVDASTITGMVFSMGGEVYANGETQFDSPEAVRVFELLETLVKEELAYQNPVRTFNDQAALAHHQIAFTLRTSSSRTHIGEIFEDSGDWGMTRIPQTDPEDPHTVLYGANICIFNTTEEQRQAAWGFIRYFTSTESCVRWALETGYLPIRKSAADHPAMQAFWAEWEHNRAGFDCLSFARAAPNVAGWQAVRVLVHKAETAVLTGMMSAQEAAATLKRDADAVLQAH